MTLREPGQCSETYAAFFWGPIRALHHMSICFSTSTSTVTLTSRNRGREQRLCVPSPDSSTQESPAYQSRIKESVLLLQGGGPAQGRRGLLLVTVHAQLRKQR